jgi:hypothetical protein
VSRSGSTEWILKGSMIVRKGTRTTLSRVTGGTREYSGMSVERSASGRSRRPRKEA